VRAGPIRQSQQLNEFIDRDAGLSQDGAKRTAIELFVIRDDELCKRDRRGATRYDSTADA